MKYLLDTDTSVYYLNGLEQIVAKVADVGAHSLRISIITLAELYYGAANSSKPQRNRQRLLQLTKRIKILPFDDECAKNFGILKTDLKQAGEIIEDFDIVIASTALTFGCTLVTNNVDHFKRIENLRIRNWTKS